MDYKFLKQETPVQGICVLYISCPQTLNALSRGVLEELDSFVDAIGPEVRCLVIRGGPVLCCDNLISLTRWAGTSR